MEAAGPHTVDRSPRTPAVSRGPGAAGLGCALATMVGACGYPFPEPYETDHAVYAELADYPDVELELPTLAEHETELVLAIGPDDVGTGALESLLLAARRRGVPVRAWLLLDDDDGYWPGQGNLAAFRDHVDAFWSWNRRGKLGVERIVVDLEPPLAVSNELVAALEEDRLEDAVPILLANRDAEAFATAQAQWADAVDQWKDDGMAVDVVALPYVLDDFADGDADLQDMFESPVDGIAWDEVGFMVYQNLYGRPDARLGPDLVRSYGATAVERYGDRAAVALGTIGDIGKNTSSIGYADVEALRADVHAVASAGVPRFRLFSFDGMRQNGGVGAWLEDLELVPAEIPANPAVQDARDLIATLDAL